MAQGATFGFWNAQGFLVHDEQQRTKKINYIRPHILRSDVFFIVEARTTQTFAETVLRDILTTLDQMRPDLVVVDSIQTMWADNVDSAPGSVSQVRAAAHELTAFANKLFYISGN